MGLFADIAGIGQAVAGIGSLFGLFGGNDDEPEGLNEIRQAAANYNRLVSSLDPSSAEFKRLQKEEEDRMRMRFAEDMKNLVVANRRASARGLPLLNPERRDETMTMALARNNETLRDRARDNVRNYLLQQVGAAQGGVSQYQPLMNFSIAQQQGRRQQRAGGLEAIFTAARALDGNPFGTSGQPWVNPDTQPYNPLFSQPNWWRQMNTPVFSDMGRVR